MNYTNNSRKETFQVIQRSPDQAFSVREHTKSSLYLTFLRHRFLSPTIYNLETPVFLLGSFSVVSLSLRFPIRLPGGTESVG